MKCSDVIRVLGNYNALVQVGYKRAGKYTKSGIIKMRNVTMEHIDHWDFEKYVGMILPCVDKQGRKYIFINLYDER